MFGPTEILSGIHYSIHESREIKWSCNFHASIWKICWRSVAFINIIGQASPLIVTQKCVTWWDVKIMSKSKIKTWAFIIFALALKLLWTFLNIKLICSSTTTIASHCCKVPLDQLFMIIQGILIKKSKTTLNNAINKDETAYKGAWNIPSEAKTWKDTRESTSAFNPSRGTATVGGWTSLGLSDTTESTTWGPSAEEIGLILQLMHCPSSLGSDILNASGLQPERTSIFELTSTNARY